MPQSQIRWVCCEHCPAPPCRYWTLDRAAGVVTYALEDRIPDNSWSAFGFNPPSAKTLNMIPSDVTMTTAGAGGGMAVDYYLKDRVRIHELPPLLQPPCMVRSLLWNNLCDSLDAATLWLEGTPQFCTVMVLEEPLHLFPPSKCPFSSLLAAVTL
jgi:hypothetical protein